MGYDAFLVGERLITQPDPGRALRELRGAGRIARQRSFEQARRLTVPTRVKVCGIRRLEDALLAVELGARALGFVFWPRSPRAVTVDRPDITARLPPFVARVGVFVNQPPRRGARDRGPCRPDRHPAARRRGCRGICGTPFRVIKALPVGEGFTLSAVDGVRRGMTVLLDAHDPVRRGGTGRRSSGRSRPRPRRRRPVILSGGLTPENVQRRVRTVRPYAVDVSSGVEAGARAVKDRNQAARVFRGAAIVGRVVNHDSGLRPSRSRRARLLRRVRRTLRAGNARRAGRRARARLLRGARGRRLPA